MAGPSAILWFPRPLPRPFDPELARVGMTHAGTCSVVDTRVVGGRFSGEPRPFVWGAGIPRWMTNAPDSDEAAALELACGWRPVDSLELAAMCNQAIDHQVLAELCAWAADTWNGIVDLGGDPGPKDARVSELVGAGVVVLPGELHGGVYMTAAALREWMLHPAFRMVK